MAKQSVFVPDGQYCSDNTHLGCFYEEHPGGGLHICRLFNESIGTLQEFTVNGERQRAFLKCETCRKNMSHEGSDAIIID